MQHCLQVQSRRTLPVLHQGAGPPARNTKQQVGCTHEGRLLSGAHPTCNDLLFCRLYFDLHGNRFRQCGWAT